MRPERLLGIPAPFLRGLPVLGFGVLAAGALALTLQPHAGRPGRSGLPPFEVRARPSTQTVRPGAPARYRITIHRGRYDGAIWLTAVPSKGLRLGGATAASTGRAGLPSRSRGVTLWVRRQLAFLNVRTDPTDDPGAYFVRVGAEGDRYRTTLKLGLVVAAAESVPFAIAGNFGTLWPGTSQAVDLLLSNPNGQPISVRSLTVGLRSVSAPRASRALPCSTSDFAVTQFTGTYPVTLPAQAKQRLSDLGVPAPLWPRVTMINRAVNQNGCQGATLTVGYSGEATAP